MIATRSVLLKVCWIVLGLDALYVVASALALWEAAHARTKAEALLQDLHTIRLGDTTFENAQRLASRQGGVVSNRTPSWSSELCGFDFLYENALLSRLHLAPQTLFSVTLRVFRGRVVMIMSGMVSGIGLGFERYCYTHVQEELEHPEGPRPLEIRPYRYAGQRPWKLHIRLTPAATPAQRDLACSFNLRCLDTTGGCRNTAELTPAA